VAESAGAEIGAAAAVGVEADSLGSPLPAVSPAELAWRKRLLLGAAPAAGLVVLIGVFSIFFWPAPPPQRPGAEVQGAAEPAPDPQPTPSEDPPAPPEPDPQPAAEEAEYPDSPGLDAYRQLEGQPPATATDVVQQPADSLFQTQEPDPASPNPLSPEVGDANQQPGEDRIEPGPAEPEPDISPELPPDLPGERAALIEVDVEARLADKIPEIRLRDVPLAAAVDLLAGMSTVPITFDPEAMQQLAATLHDPVTVELSEATIGQVLEEVVSSRGLAVVVEDGHVLLTFPADRRERLWPRRYTVSDLTGQDQAAVDELAELVRKLVAPDSWRRSGGRGSIKAEAAALAVVQTGVVHHEILTFCEKLRNARGKPLRSKLQNKSSPDRFALAPRPDQAKQALGRPVTANFHQPTPLIEVLAHLGQLAETDILIDRPALAAAGLSDRTEASVTAEKQPLGEALDALLGPLGLQYRVIDARTLQVTTRKAAAARLELEFYEVGGLLGDQRTGAALVEQIKGRLAGSTWSDAGGPGVLHFDQPSDCLIVLQSQPVQVELQSLLAELRN
jgi:hypothetical protein